jgi:hypothetical protein
MREICGERRVREQFDSTNDDASGARMVPNNAALKRRAARNFLCVP